MNQLVSVVVATYRREESLRNALISLAEQTYSPIEVIVVDDNAESDWNARVLTAIEELKKDSPGCSVHYIANTQNQGSAKTRNKGIAAASGEYITFLDDDDVYLPSKVERQVSFMQEGEIDYSITDLHLYNESDKLIDKRVRTYIGTSKNSSLLELHLKYHLTGTDAMMFRKEYLVAIGGFPPIDVGDEFYLMQCAIEKGGKFGYLPGCDVRAYVHTGEGGLSSGGGKIAGENALYAHKKQYFEQIGRKTVKYIKARHFAVIAYAYLRMHRYGAFFKNVCLGFVNSPCLFLGILLKR